MKKIISLLSVLTISGTAVPTTIAASPYKKQENNTKNLIRNKRQIDNKRQLSSVVNNTSLGRINGPVTNQNILRAFILSNSNLPNELRQNRRLIVQWITSDERSASISVAGTSFNDYNNLNFEGSVTVNFNPRNQVEDSDNYFKISYEEREHYSIVVPRSQRRNINNLDLRTNLGNLPNAESNTIINRFLELNSGIFTDQNYMRRYLIYTYNGRFLTGTISVADENHNFTGSVTVTWTNNVINLNEGTGTAGMSYEHYRGW